MKPLSAIALSAVLVVAVAGCGAHRAAGSSTTSGGSSSPAAQETSRGRGLIENTDAPFSQKEFLATGRWSGVVNGRLAVAYAGQAGVDDAQTGQLRVDWFGRKEPIVVRTYPGVGALRIISVTNGVLTARDRHAVSHVVDLRAIVH